MQQLWVQVYKWQLGAKTAGWKIREANLTGDFKVDPTNLWAILAGGAIQTIGDYRPILEFVGGDLRQLPVLARF